MSLRLVLIESLASVSCIFVVRSGKHPTPEPTLRYVQNLKSSVLIFTYHDDTQGGTIVHESSHYLRNGGTQDYVYGQSGAKALARSNPSEAIENADSHEYFAENNPALS